MVGYTPIFLYSLVVAAFAIGTLVMAHIIGPRRFNPVKQSVYESGVDPIGGARQHFDVKFYLVAVSFLIFDVELLFLYPYAVVAYQEGVFSPDQRRVLFWAISAFLVLLIVGFVYEWRKGILRWR